VLPRIAAGAVGRPVRAWSVGTGEGEEAWTLAMLLSSSGQPWEVFGTDRSAGAIATAQAGEYPASESGSVPAALAPTLEPAAYDRIRVGPSLRAHTLFSVHDLLGRWAAPGGAILASFDLVVLRDVVPDLAPPSRGDAVRRVAASVRGGGALLLGAAEAEAMTEPGFSPFPWIDPRLGVFLRTTP
jgi:chemotaxis methyl-accepting protein methylase